MPLAQVLLKNEKKEGKNKIKGEKKQPETGQSRMSHGAYVTSALMSRRKQDLESRHLFRKSRPYTLSYKLMNLEQGVASQLKKRRKSHNSKKYVTHEIDRQAAGRDVGR